MKISLYKDLGVLLLEDCESIKANIPLELLDPSPPPFSDLSRVPADPSDPPAPTARNHTPSFFTFCLVISFLDEHLVSFFFMVVLR